RRERSASAVPSSFSKSTSRDPMFVPLLREIQERCGYLPREELERLSARLEVPLHRLHEVITFFPHFRLKPPPDVEGRVGRDQACHLRGAVACRERLEAARERQLNALIGRLKEVVTLRRFEPGDLIFRQGAPAVEGMYLVRTGFVKISQSRPGANVS